MTPSVEDAPTTEALIARHGLSFPVTSKAGEQVVAEETSGLGQPGTDVAAVDRISASTLVGGGGSHSYSGGAIGRLVLVDVMGKWCALSAHTKGREPGE